MKGHFFAGQPGPKLVNSKKIKDFPVWDEKYITGGMLSGEITSFPAKIGTMVVLLFGPGGFRCLPQILQKYCVNPRLLSLPRLFSP
jgi:hypothetical protein